MNQFQVAPSVKLLHKHSMRSRDWKLIFSHLPATYAFGLVLSILLSSIFLSECVVNGLFSKTNTYFLLLEATVSETTSNQLKSRKQGLSASWLEGVTIIQSQGMNKTWSSDNWLIIRVEMCGGKFQGKKIVNSFRSTACHMMTGSLSLNLPDTPYIGNI